MHKWAFVGASGSTPAPESKRAKVALVAVCSEFGMVRSILVIAAQDGTVEKQTDLSGKCPGRPVVDRTPTVPDDSKGRTQWPAGELSQPSSGAA
jgi:hypothetical protein